LDNDISVIQNMTDSYYLMLEEISNIQLQKKQLETDLDELKGRQKRRLESQVSYYQTILANLEEQKNSAKKQIEYLQETIVNEAPQIDIESLIGLDAPSLTQAATLKVVQLQLTTN
jgi:chromosome segregation ATPase